jgi:hypothetical protein
MTNAEAERIARDLVTELRSRLPAPNSWPDADTEGQLVRLAGQMVALVQSGPLPCLDKDPQRQQAPDPETANSDAATSADGRDGSDGSDGSDGPDGWT